MDCFTHTASLSTPSRKTPVISILRCVAHHWLCSFSHISQKHADFVPRLKISSERAIVIDRSQLTLILNGESKKSNSDARVREVPTDVSSRDNPVARIPSKIPARSRFFGRCGL